MVAVANAPGVASPPDLLFGFTHRDYFHHFDIIDLNEQRHGIKPAPKFLSLQLLLQNSYEDIDRKVGVVDLGTLCFKMNTRTSIVK